MCRCMGSLKHMVDCERSCFWELLALRLIINVLKVLCQCPCLKVACPRLCGVVNGLPAEHAVCYRAVLPTEKAPQCMLCLLALVWARGAATYSSAGGLRPPAPPGSLWSLASLRFVSAVGLFCIVT